MRTFKNTVIILICNSLISCLMPTTLLKAQDKEATAMAKNWIPYLQSDGTFRYVDINLKPHINTTFYSANRFTETGYAVVRDNNRKTAIIDSTGAVVVDFTDENLTLEVVNDLTLLMTDQEYDKKMPFWKWDWNIMSNDIKKFQVYRLKEIRVLETNQRLFLQDVPAREADYSLNTHHVDDNHVVLNDVLFEIKNQKFIKQKSNIDLVLDNGRYIPASESSFAIYELKNKKPIRSNLIATDKISISLDKQAFILDSINQDRYAPSVPKTLYGSINNDVYVYPQYDKAFPKEIIHASAEQLNFLKEVSLIYSINNSPYFILGRFNYDHAVWAYDWLYLDLSGKLWNDIRMNDFFISDQIGYLVWPTKDHVLSKQELEKKHTIGKIKHLSSSKNLFIVTTKNKDEAAKKGLWNADTQSWDIEPLYYTIDVLDDEYDIFAIQKEENGTFMLYNNKTKQQIGSNTYDYIANSGFVRKTEAGEKQIYFFIDIKTGKEYRD